MIWRQTPWSLCNKWLHHCQKLTVVFVINNYCSPATWYIVWKLKQVTKKYIFDTNTSWQMFTPFTDASFINNCLLQRMLYVNHPLLQFADITDPFLNTATSFSRFCSHNIHIWAVKVASYVAIVIWRSHVQYDIVIGSSCYFHVSQGSVETYFRWCKESLWQLCTKLPLEYDSDRILKIGLDLPKLWSKVECIVFWDTLYIGCVAFNAGHVTVGVSGFPLRHLNTK